MACTSIALFTLGTMRKQVYRRSWPRSDPLGRADCAFLLGGTGELGSVSITGESGTRRLS